jgi:hypothetical protein
LFFFEVEKAWGNWIRKLKGGLIWKRSQRIRLGTAMGGNCTVSIDNIFPTDIFTGTCSNYSFITWFIQAFLTSTYLSYCTVNQIKSINNVSTSTCLCLKYVCDIPRSRTYSTTKNDTTETVTVYCSMFHAKQIVPTHATGSLFNICNLTMF